MKTISRFHPKNGKLMTDLLLEFQPRRLMPSLTAGCILGILNISLSISFAALIFSGDLSVYMSRGIGFILFGACAIGLIVSFTSSLPGTIAAPQEIPAAIFALIAMLVVKSLPVAQGSDNTFVTLMAIIMITSVLTGIIFLLLGALKLGNLTRFIPYPVIGGFLAGTGWLLVQGAFYVMTDMPIDFIHLPEIFSSANLIKWIPGVIFGAILLFFSRRSQHFLVMPVIILIGIVLFFLALMITGTSVSDAETGGWLLGPFPQGGLWQPFSFEDVKQIQWSAMDGEIRWNMGTIFLLGIISLLLNAAGLEIAIGRDIDLNHELVSAGIGNIFTGFGGGIVGFHTLSDTALGHRITPNSRLSGILSAIICGVTMFFGASLLSFFPRFLAGSLLFFLGLGFLVEWIYDARKTLPKTDYVLVLVILLIVGTFGLLQGVFTGFLMTIIIFVMNYSRISVIKHKLSGRMFQSTVERSVMERRKLHEKGEAIVILKLHGFIFFGTANALYQQIREQINESESPPVRFLVLDFQLVSGLDSSTLNSFLKLKQLAATQGVILVFSRLLPEIEQLLCDTGYQKDKDDPLVRFFSHLDQAVEWCEEQILITEGPEMRSAINPNEIDLHENDMITESALFDIMKVLDQQKRFEGVVSDLMPYLEREERLEGEYVIRQGSVPKAMYFIESGQVVVLFENQYNKKTRLRTMNAGTVIGELGVHLKRPTSATVIMKKPGVIYRFSNQALDRMKTEEPQKAIRFHEFMVYLLSERVISTNNTLQALLY